MATVSIGKRMIGDGEPVYIIAEIGINHNGSLKKAMKLVKSARNAGCDCVKFQKRTPELCVPKDQWNIERDTPWGRMSYIEYRHKVELSVSGTKNLLISSMLLMFHFTKQHQLH